MTTNVTLVAVVNNELGESAASYLDELDEMIRDEPTVVFGEDEEEGND